MYKGKRLVIKSKEERQQIISDVHQAIRGNCKAKAMTSRRGRDSTYQKCSEIFFWHNMLGDVSEYIKRYEMYQKHGKMQNFISP